MVSYPKVVRIGRRNAATGEYILTIKLNPASWGVGHDLAQRPALARAEKCRQEAVRRATGE